jgi:hypothetical protein
LARTVTNDAATTVWVVEAAQSRAVIWTKPDDLDYDPAQPGAGLARRWGRSDKDRGCFVGLADGRVRVLRADTDPAVVRSLFAARPDEPVELSLPYYAAGVRLPWRGVAVCSLLIAILALLGVVPAVFPLLRGKGVSPGETLLLILAAGELVYLLCATAFLRVELLPDTQDHSQRDVVFWMLPRLAGALVAVWAMYRNWPSQAWRMLFGVNAALWGVMLLDGLIPLRYRPVEESLLTATPPLVVGSIALIAAVLTLQAGKDPAVEGRRVRHWAGILVCLLPLVAFAAFCAQGVVAPRPPSFLVPTILE